MIYRKNCVIFLSLLLAFSAVAIAQNKPKLVVGIVVDQMKGEYLSKFAARYNGGIMRLLNQGYNCANTHINYLITQDAPAYASIYTGTTPSMHGIVHDYWYNGLTNQKTYCTEDLTVRPVGTNTPTANASPIHMLASTVGDELRLASNFNSKVISIGIKDRSAVFTGGHLANGAFWFDYTKGTFITSTYYYSALPKWVESFNSQNQVESLFKLKWNFTYPIETYLNDEGLKPYQAKPFGQDQRQPPYDLSRFIGKSYQQILYTPYGNTLMFDFAKATILSEEMGQSKYADMLCLNLNATDYIGHAFGPNSIEMEDTYLKLDKDLGEFFSFLDKTIGSQNYLVFLTSSHGVASIPGYLYEHRMPAGQNEVDNFIVKIEDSLKYQFGDYNWIKAYSSPMIFLNKESLDSTHTSRETVKAVIKNLLEREQFIFAVVDPNNLENELLDESLISMVKNGIPRKLHADLVIILRQNYISGGYTGTSHGSPFSYDTQIPLVWMGAGIPHHTDYSSVDITDIASTLAAILEIQEPNSSTGKIIQGLFSSPLKHRK